MSKQKTSKIPAVGNEGIMTMEKRYYVQHLTEQVYLVRECLSADGEPGSDDRIIRSFDVRHDAYMYASSMNDTQNKLDSTAATERSTISQKGKPL